MTKEVLLVPHNHFDPTWRRCFQRAARHGGTVVRPYAELEAHVLDGWLALADRGYTFSEGQVAILRAYLARRPGRKVDLQRHAHAGRLAVLLAGETIQDTVVPTAEGLVRNFLVAWPFYRDLVGDAHPGLKLGWLMDAFGNSPNYPQILKGVGAEAACCFTYRTCDQPEWVGIDGTALPNFDLHPQTCLGAVAKHAPCPACRGRGCARCRRTGLQWARGFDLAALGRMIGQTLSANPKARWIEARIVTEEFLPERAVLEFCDAWNRAHRRGPVMRLATFADVWARMKADAKPAGRRVAPPITDPNPAMPGCLVTRIRCKQRTRAAAYRLLCAEATVANAAWAAKRPRRQPADVTAAWRQVAFNQFHDAITGTHIDSAYRELMGMLDRADAVAARYLPPARPREMPGRFRPITGTATLRLGRHTIRFDRTGILGIRTGGRDLFGDAPARFNPNRRPFRIGEIALEPDFGDAWGTRIPPLRAPHAAGHDFSSVFLGDYHARVEASARAIRWRGRYTGGDWKVRRLAWATTLSVAADGRRLEFRTEVDWDTGSRRLRVLVPVRSQDPNAIYEVPFGFIERRYEAEKLDYSQWKADQREFGALHWVCKRIDRRSGVAVLNRGLPCNRWIPGCFDLSLVRSPEWAFCLVEPSSYEFWDTEGQRDAGRHVFDYALVPFVDGLTNGDLTRMGYAYNLPVPLAPPFAIAGDVIVTAWKLAEDGQGWILRLQEIEGRASRVRLDFGEERQVAVTDLLERPQGEPTHGAIYAARIHRHGVLTLRIR